PLALQRRLVRAVAASLDSNFEFRHVEEILSLGPQGKASLPNARNASRCEDFITFGPSRDVPADYAHLLPMPGSLDVPEAGLILETVFLTNAADAASLLDLRFAQRELVVRNWRPGERFWAHAREPKKIKELLQDRHITGDEKRNWPVIASAGEIVWMRGFGVRRDFRAKDGQGILIRERDSGNSQLQNGRATLE